MLGEIWLYTYMREKPFSIFLIENLKISISDVTLFLHLRGKKKSSDWSIQIHDLTVSS